MNKHTVSMQVLLLGENNKLLQNIIQTSSIYKLISK